MKKNKMMRLASFLLVATLLTTSMISGTFAKYVTSADSNDSARVAKWGWEPAQLDFENLFANSYVSANGTTVVGEDGADVIAPGTEGFVTFAFAYDFTEEAEKPEVAYKFEVSTEGSSCDANIQNNTSIRWYLNDEEKTDPMTWTELMTAIEDLDGNKDYAPGELPENFGEVGDVQTVGWKWVFEDNNDAMDTGMGNLSDLDDVALSIKITATQID